jgi:Predicted ATPase with chaperone activity
MIAASGFHNVHLRGVPGAGKTMLCRAFISILPPMEKEEILEVSKIYSVSGLLNQKKFITNRPFRAPHHTTSRIGLIGGGTNPTPGEISLSHRGVLFLDEFPEFPRSVLEALRQPLEDGAVTISRASGSITFPSRFLLLAASNPCPCGFLGHPKKACHCLPGAIIKYKKRLSGPILDRIDIHVDLPPVDEEKLAHYTGGESSKKIKEKVIFAQERQKNRFKNTNIKTNGEMNTKEIKEFCHLTFEAESLLKQAISRFSLSARSYFKIIKIAQTIADLEGKEKIENSHVAEALQFRLSEEN